jgi:hypothetical protein
MRLVYVFFDQDMRCTHEGLNRRMKKELGDNFKLQPGMISAFINRKKDRVMVLAGLKEADTFGVMGYYRSPHGRVDSGAIKFIPDAFDGGSFNMDRAIQKVIIEKLGVRE